MIKKCIAISLLLFFSSGVSALQNNETQLTPLPEHNISTRMINRFIDQFHYKDTELDDKQSKAILEQYIKTLDPSRIFFLQSDIDTFNRFQTILDDSLLDGNVEPAFIMLRAFNRRRIERADYAISLLDKKFDFTIDEEYQFDREDNPWPQTTKEINELWRKRVKNDVLMLSLAGKSDEELKKTLHKRYERIKTRAKQFNSEDTYETFINAYMKSIEPHTAYFSPRTSENFKINMSLSLEGIGAVLQGKDDYTVVRSVIKGGPADMGGQLHSEDRIVGVAQGKNGEMEDVIGWRLDDVVDLIRGPKDSVVRLQILPKASGLDGPSKEITIVRNEIKLEEQQVKKSVIEIPNGPKQKPTKIGVITVPTFYLDIDAASRGDENYRGTTSDTKTLISELKAEGVEGIIMDLRGNGGGALSEAVSLTGLFIKDGPVVQVQESTGEVSINEDTDDEIAYGGPLAVLVDRHSASASEIFAGAIQDYGRGIIIGEPTFGKGTVQSIINLNQYLRRGDVTLGQIKMTIAKFFRVSGDSTQHRGVVPDVLFPTVEDDEDQGESSLENALPWERISATKFTPAHLMDIDLDKIIENHQQRVDKDNGFKFLLSQAEDRLEQRHKKSVTLLKSKRKKERDALEDIQFKRINKFRTAHNMKPLKKSEILDDGEDDIGNEDDNERFIEEVELIGQREAANILIDMIHTTNRTAQTNRKSGGAL